MSLVEITDLYKSYETGGEETKVLLGLDLVAEEGEMIMIMGPSGCGKTTLLNLMGGIDKPNEGKIYIAGQEITKLRPKDLNSYRLRNVGFIFQFYNLIPTLTAQENVELGIEPLLKNRRELTERARKYLELVGLEDKMNNFPQELSAGEQQRVAVARALAKEPKVILADEPTGNLDEDRSKSIMELMKGLQDELGITFFIVCHNPQLEEFTDRTLHLRRGKLEQMAG